MNYELPTISNHNHVLYVTIFGCPYYCYVPLGSKKINSNKSEQSNITSSFSIISCFVKCKRSADMDDLWYVSFSAAKFQTRTPVKVKVHCIATGETFGAIDSIKNQLKINSEPSSQIRETKTREECNIIIFFRPVSHCVELEVKSAMKETAGNENIHKCTFI